MTTAPMHDICARAPVIPVLTVDDPGRAEPLARALVEGGLRVLEVTLRTPPALEVIGVIARNVPEAIVGAGTLRTPEDVARAAGAGARFGVSPGLAPSLLARAQALELPFLPGVATPSEAMSAAELGCRMLKFFPAEASGGVAALSAWADPLSGLAFCPTGGIGPGNAPDYLRLANVTCVGGSWVAPPARIRAGDWTGIRESAARAAALAGSVS